MGNCNCNCLAKIRNPKNVHKKTLQGIIDNYLKQRELEKSQNLAKGEYDG
jgi:hypothetical protein